MRVIAGTHRGRPLKAPAGRGTRPTTDRVREALFSMLGDCEGARVLDLFAGSGALGIEALSRGAESAEFVDNDAAAVTAISANLERLGLAGEVHRRGALVAIREAAQAGREYDLIFLDPPYRLAGELGPKLAVVIGSVLAPAGRVVAESDRQQPLELEITLLRERHYGDTLIRIYADR